MLRVGRAWWRASRPRRWANAGRLLRPISIRACLPLPDRSRLRAVPRSNGVKPTPRRCLSLITPSTSCSVSSGSSSSRIGWRRCARCARAVPRRPLVVMVWHAIGQAPGFAVLAAALERHIGPEPPRSCEPRSRCATPRISALSSPREVSRRSISEQKSGPFVSASVERFLASYVAGSPLPRLFAAAPPEARDALLAEVVAGLEQFVGGEELKFPIEASLARARKAVSSVLSCSRCSPARTSTGRASLTRVGRTGRARRVQPAATRASSRARDSDTDRAAPRARARAGVAWLVHRARRSGDREVDATARTPSPRQRREAPRSCASSTSST